MNILIIMPRMNSDSRYAAKLSSILNIYPDLTISQLASICSKKHNVQVIFEKFEKIKYNYDVDIVGISCMTPSAPHAYEIADEFRRNGKKVILGGWHPSALPEEAKQHADSVVIGEAETILPELLEDYKKGILKSYYKNSSEIKEENIISANRNFIKNVSFIAGIQSSRGCPNRCEFCQVSNIEYGDILRKRPIKNVIHEIENIKQKNLYFYDPSLTIDCNHTKELFKAMIGLNKKFTSFGNINVLERDDELLKLASEAGCKNWFVGFESISQKTIDNLGKKSNKVKKYYSAIKKIHDNNMSVIGSFIFGFDSDTKDVFDKTVNTVIDLGIDFVDFAILTPYPGTPLFSRLEKEGRILTHDWNKYTQKGNVVFKPMNLTPNELLDGIKDADKKVNSINGFIKRIIISKRFIMGNFIGNIMQI